MSGYTKTLICLTIFCLINTIYSFVVSYIFTLNEKDFVETFVIMNFVFYLQLSIFPIGLWHERLFLRYRMTKDPNYRKKSVKSSIVLLVVGFILMTAGIFIAGFTTPRYYGHALEFLKMLSVVLALFGLLACGLILRKEIEENYKIEKKV